MATLSSTVERSLARNRTHFLLALAALTAAYFLAGKLGLALAFLHESASPVWPPTGLALAAFLLLGQRVWPAILAGAFLVNVTTEAAWPVAAAIAVGNTLEGVVGAALVRRFAAGVRAFHTPGGVFSFAVVAGFVATAISASVGVASLAVGDLLPSDWGRVWLTWWLGDAAGAWVVAPALILWAGDASVQRWASRPGEAALLFFTALAACAVVFASEPRPIEFLCLPPLLWAAFRFGPRDTATLGVVISAIAVVATLRGHGPFVRPTPNESLLLLQAFMGLTTTLSLAVAASVRTREESDARAQRLNDELERRIEERTQELSDSNTELSHEIAERRRADQDLRRSETRLREAQGIGHIGSWEWDIVADRVWWSDELYRIYGLDPARFAGSYDAFLELVHPEDRARVDEVLRRAFEDRLPFSFEHRIVRPGGEVRVLSAQGRVLADAAGEPERMLGTGQDVTESKRAEREREELMAARIAQRQAEEANRAKDEFLAVLSHELRTPLSAILGWAQLLRDAGLDAEGAKRAVDTIVRNAEAQTRILSDVLDVSRIVSGKLTLDRSVLELVPVVEMAVESLRPRAAERGVRLELHCQERRVSVDGDSARLQQVVLNLLSNAIRFAPSKEGLVRTTVRSVDGEVEISVADNGQGVPPEFLPHVFDRFRQADASSTRRHGGLGLGLAIVRHLVELHGGSARAENNAGAPGATFTVRLPSVASLARAAGPEASTMSSGASLAGLNVLVVDDEPDARALTLEFLERRGAKVATAASVAAAILAIERERPHVVLTDIAMPGEDGFALLARIRASSEHASLPIAALTAYASAEDRRKMLAAGFDEHLSKPLDSGEVARVAAELGRRGAEDGPDR